MRVKLRFPQKISKALEAEGGTTWKRVQRAAQHCRKRFSVTQRSGFRALAQFSFKEEGTLSKAMPASVPAPASAPGSVSDSSRLASQ